MLNDRTQIMTEGTPDYPLDPAAAETAEACPHCTTLIPAGEQFCIKCGYQRGSWQPAAAASPAIGAVQNTRPAAPFTLRATDGTLYPLVLGENTVGGSATDIMLSDSFISRRHAQLTVSADRVQVIDLGSSNGTYVAGQRLIAQQEAELQPDTAVRFGQTEFTLITASMAADTPDGAQTLTATLPTATEAEVAVETTTEEPAAEVLPTAAALEPAQLELRPAASPWSLWRGEQLEFVVPFGTSSIGRKPEHADFVLRGDGYVSGLHARLVATVDTLEVCDLGSTNGTYVNGVRSEPSVVTPLAAGDILRLGQTDLSVHYDSAVATAD